MLVELVIFLTMNPNFKYFFFGLGERGVGGLLE